jgi:hypothetical protein
MKNLIFFVEPLGKHLDANRHVVEFAHFSGRKWIQTVSFGDRFTSAR